MARGHSGFVTTFLFYAAALLVGFLVAVAIAIVYVIMSDDPEFDD